MIHESCPGIYIPSVTYDIEPQFRTVLNLMDICYMFIPSLTSQNLAPYVGGGESQNRYLLRVPPPQVVVQCVHGLQAPHPPVSESETRHSAHSVKQARNVVLRALSASQLKLTQDSLLFVFQSVSGVI